MAADWITIQQAAALLGRTPEEVSTSLDQDEVETLSVGDVSGAIRLVPKEYVDRELEAQTDEAGVEPAPSGGPVQAQKVEPETVEAGGEDEGPPMHQLTQVIKDRYEAIVEAIHRPGNGNRHSPSLAETRVMEKGYCRGLVSILKRRAALSPSIKSRSSSVIFMSIICFRFQAKWSGR